MSKMHPIVALRTIYLHRLQTMTQVFFSMYIKPTHSRKKLFTQSSLFELLYLLVLPLLNSEYPLLHQIYGESLPAE